MSDERNFRELLEARWTEGKFVCVGLDSITSRIPQVVRESEVSSGALVQFAFNSAVVEATCDLVCAYKPNLAFYRGASGKMALHDTIRFINKRAPGVPVILDAKQADIGSSNDGYVAEDFDFYRADAVTVNPYLGMEAMKPFLDQKNKGIIVLDRTSNPGAGEFQDVMVDIGEELADAWGLSRRRVYHGGDDIVSWSRMPLYQYVAHRLVRDWNYNRNCCAVVGATYPQELKEIREIVGDMPILIPGVGTQGGTAADAVENGHDSRGQGMIINVSSLVIYASSGPDFAEAARAATQKVHDEITVALAAVA